MDTEDLAGGLLHAVLQEFDVCLSATFSNKGESSTWISLNGTEHRIDFVAIPCSWIGQVQEAFVDDEVELITKKPDHEIAAVVLK
jgi:hypothetical protein